MSAIPTTAGRKINRALPNHEYDPRQEQCVTCRFWQPEQRTEPEDAADPTAWTPGFGFCRRNPPRLIETLVAMTASKPLLGRQQDMDQLFTGTDAFDATSFPGTYYTEWCGRFEWLRDLEPMSPLC